MHCEPLQKFTDSILEIQAKLSSDLDFNTLELSLRNAFHELVDHVLLPTLQTILDNRIWFLVALKQLAAKKGSGSVDFAKPLSGSLPEEPCRSLHPIL